jgi:chromosome segregation ATPase
VQAQHAHDIEELQSKLSEQDMALQQGSEVIKKLRGTEVELRQERRKLENDRDALQAEKERMRDEIRKQERDEATLRSQERFEASLRQKDEAYAVQIRELEQKLNRVNTQLDEARRWPTAAIVTTRARSSTE